MFTNFRMSSLIQTREYKDFICDIKSRIQSAQIKAAVKVNNELLRLYWKLGGLIVKKQKETAWGEGLITSVSNDLKRKFPSIKGFSPTNIKYMRNWYLFYAEGNHSQIARTLNSSNRPQVVDEIFQIPWGHNREIITKCKTVDEALYYARQTIKYSWSRAVLVHHISSNLMER